MCKITVWCQICFHSVKPLYQCNLSVSSLFAAEFFTFLHCNCVSYHNLSCVPQTHSLTHRRAVPGRRKHFDVLLAEHKGRPKEGAKDKEKERNGTGPAKEGGSQRVTSHETASPSKPHCPNGRLLSSLKLRLANAHIPRSDTGNPQVSLCIQQKFADILTLVSVVLSLKRNDVPLSF